MALEDRIATALHAGLDDLAVTEVPSSIRRRAVRRYALLSGAAAVAVTAAFVLIAPSDLQKAGRPSPAQPAGEPSSERSDVDLLAADVIARLGPLCRSFDYYYRATVAGGELRPVQCGLRTEVVQGEDGRPVVTSRGLEVDWVRAPRILIYAFQDQATRNAWLRNAPLMGGARFSERRWVVDVLTRPLIDDAIRALGRDALVRDTPMWAIGAHRFRALREARNVEVSLDEAVDQAKLVGGEILQAGLFRYSPPDGGRRVVWVVTLRRCVPSYGGLHAQRDCRGSRTHFVLHPRTADVVAELIT